MIAPSIHLVAYEARDGRVFVKVPDQRGRYILTDRCVIEIGCPHCKAIRGEPCKGSQGYMATTHYTRRNDYRWGRKEWRIPVDKPDQLTAKPRFKLILDKS